MVNVKSSGWPVVVRQRRVTEVWSERSVASHGERTEPITSMVGKIINFKMLHGFKGSKPRSLKDANEEALVVSQFTLAAITNKGNKPSFHKSAKPEEAKLLYDEFISLFERSYGKFKQGKFGDFMEISLINKGPITYNFKT